MQDTHLTEIYQLENYNDTFALGHYARVLDAIDRRSGQWVAFKVLRPEHMTTSSEPSAEFRAFPREADLLMKMSGSRHVVRLLDCGYLTARDERPQDGEVVSFQADTLGFIRDANVYAERGWRPYLTLENLPRSQNLLYLMQTNI
ncbi:MAG: hypothetical protein JW910_21730, partial [Anaerolineae bacterium]|nr:hypothetical protein [Anaerolineae bacterium]